MDIVGENSSNNKVIHLGKLILYFFMVIADKIYFITITIFHQVHLILKISRLKISVRLSVFDIWNKFYFIAIRLYFIWKN
jgi:hypothetical protein